MGNQTSSLNSDVYVSLDSSSRTSSPLNIKDFLIRYRKYLPLVVSTYGIKKKVRSKASFGEGHSLCVHFQKESDVVLAVSKEGAKYFVPVRSTFMCSPIYDNPRKKGTVFEGVQELLQHSPLPQIVYTTQGYLSPSGEETSSVEEGQILAIKGTEILNGQNTLWCIDIHSYEQKNLEMSCTASFSTDTSLLRLVLASVIDHLTLPIDVVFSAPDSHGSSCVGFPESLICTLTNKFETQSIITSPYSANPSSNPPKNVVEILSDAPIQVCVLSLSKDEERVLKEMTRNLLTTFSPNLVAEVVGHITTPIDTKIQTALFQCLEQDYYWSKEFVSKELVATLTTPSHNQAQVPSRNKILPTNFYEKEEEEDAEISEDTYEEVGTFNQQVIQAALPSTIPSLPILPTPKHNLSPSMMQRHSIDTASLASQLRKQDSNKTDNEISNDTRERNKEILDNYSVTEVLKLLEDMNLGQYKKKFEEEQITGSLLLEIDDDILQNELGVTSKLHRLKITRIIEGRQTLFK
ncbi:PREDICTED: uncharacterized protein LOC109585561 [Amphimedon queenslandica]|uniref:SAM domain-containing protein n=1 Tax=Amphimedon queenslandica TaxID=400682 RepID=A0A1X7VXN7_AMPQE|nr:PREDICTED: uncharacterized protein LOC109585561 [Amphimedon queenslandica]|eukprot:XP_019857261.1 PREDICTED: uncharacterized protein LOC109585561 [Amphimedon queenslandica]